MMKKISLVISIILIISIIFVGCSSNDTGNIPDTPENTENTPDASKTEGTANLPDMLNIVSYAVGSSGYNQAAGVSNALTEMFGTQIRIVPNDTSVGRMMVMDSGQTEYGFFADEVYFAYYGLFDFAEKNWGPRDLRVIMAKPTTVGMATTKTGGIKVPADLKGKKISYTPGNTSHITKAEAYLAFADLTWDDVEIVHMPSSPAGVKSLIEGAVDAVITAPNASALYEVEASPVGVDWVELPAEDVEGWKRLNEVLPFLSPAEETLAAGLKDGEVRELAGYTYPQVICLADKSADEVYEFVKALDEAYPLYKNMDPQAENWAIEVSSNIPNGAPYHEGAIRYFKELGLWNDEKEAWNNQMIKEGEEVREAWDTVIKEAEEKNIKDEDFAEYWLQRRFEITGKKN